jgi:hypothetical protein
VDQKAPELSGEPAGSSGRKLPADSCFNQALGTTKKWKAKEYWNNGKMARTEQLQGNLLFDPAFPHPSGNSPEYWILTPGSLSLNSQSEIRNSKSPLPLLAFLLEN